MLNTFTTPQRLPKGSFLGELKVAHVVDSAHSPEEAPLSQVTGVHPGDEKGELADIVNMLTARLPSELSSDQYRQATALLTEFRDIFSTTPYDMGRTTLVEHTIETGNSRPIRQGLRRHPATHLEDIDRQVDEMLHHDIVEPVSILSRPKTSH